MVLYIKKVLSPTRYILDNITGNPQPREVRLAGLSDQERNPDVAYIAKDSVRRAVIGLEAVFDKHYSVEEIEYGDIELRNPTRDEQLFVPSLSIYLTSEGWTRIDSNQPQSKNSEILEAKQQEAQSRKLGVWAEKKMIGPQVVPRPDYSSFFKQMQQYGEMDAVIEEMYDVGVFMAYIRQHALLVDFQLTGVSCPSYLATPRPEMFAEEAKEFIEKRVVQRDVKLKFDTFLDNTIFCTILHPKGDITKLLLEMGFAGLDPKTSRAVQFPESLVQAQESAKYKGLRRWAPIATKKEMVEDYEAKVIEIVSGDQIIVRPFIQTKNAEIIPSSEERRLYISFIRSPKLPAKFSPNDYLGFKAKDTTRSLLAKKSVNIHVDYIKAPFESAAGARPPPPSDSQGRMHFVSVTVGDVNVAEVLLSKGLAQLSITDQESNAPENYQKALATATEKELGLHSTKKERLRLIDIAQPGMGPQAQMHLKDLRPKGVFEVVVEAVINAGRFKVRLADTLQFSLSLAGIRCPITSPMTSDVPSEPFAIDAQQYVKNEVLQKSAFVSIETSDRGGTFIGTLYKEKGGKPMNVELASLGFAYPSNFPHNNFEIQTQIEKAIEKAKEERLGVWGLEPTSQDTSEVPDLPLNEKINVFFSHAFGPQEFYVNQQLSILRPLQAQIARECGKGFLSSAYYDERSPPSRGELVLGKFSGDQTWCRATVVNEQKSTTGHTMHLVKYIDFGNGEILSLEDIRRCPPCFHLSQIKALAVPCRLVDLEVTDGPHVAAAAQLFHTIIQIEEQITVETVKWAEGIHHVIATKKGESKTLNQEFVEGGYASVSKRPISKLKQTLEKAQVGARDRRLRMWQFGDTREDSDDERMFPKKKAITKAAGKKSKLPTKDENVAPIAPTPPVVAAAAGKKKK